MKDQISYVTFQKEHFMSHFTLYGIAGPIQDKSHLNLYFDTQQLLHAQTDNFNKHSSFMHKQIFHFTAPSCTNSLSNINISLFYKQTLI